MFAAASNKSSLSANKVISFFAPSLSTTFKADRINLLFDSIDVNKIIANYVFDGLVSCPVHASPLVREYNIFEIGFGLDFRENGIMVVLQYRDKKGSY